MAKQTEPSVPLPEPEDGDECALCGGEGTVSEDRWSYNPRSEGHYTVETPCLACIAAGRIDEEPDYEDPPWDENADYGE